MRPCSMRRDLSALGLGVALAAALFLSATPSAYAATCNRTITADVVAFDQVFFWNRLGAVEPQGMIYALRHDVVPIDPAQGLVPGNVMLRPDKRPRPLVLRMGVHDCLEIHFQNLLAPTPVDNEQPATRNASITVVGLQLVNSIADDGANVGTNPSSLVAPGGTHVYTLYGEREGAHVMHSAGAMTGGEGDGGSTNSGLFGAVHVEPEGSVWYRSQVTREDMDLGTRLDANGNPLLTADGHPILDYQAVYPAGHPQAGTPIFRMTDANNNLVHSDLTAIITGSDPDGPGHGRFAAGTYPPNPVYPDRDEPFREFTIMYHDEIGAVQAFPIFNDPVFELTTHSARDGFAINYGTGGIGAEILANRFGVGPMWNCTECKYEEFFLSAWAMGDPAEVVDVPANAPCTEADVQSGNQSACTPTPGPKATKVLYPDDPSNVYHSYLRDHVKFRIMHGGSKEHHIHHQHTHQWVYQPDSDESTYLDSQALGPGSTFTLEMTYNSSGNRNQAVGDSIFHCHFYPHFAQGMWSLWRVHDVFERGTVLDAEDRPAPGSRALPDGEIAAGTPIPGLVPVPGLPMAPLPATQVAIVDGQVTFPNGIQGNPGYPFFIPGIAGHRAPHPPLDIAVDDNGFVEDGGLPRHLITGGTFTEVHTRLDFTKELENVSAVELNEQGEPVEQAAMTFHEQRLHPTCLPDGTCDPSITGAHHGTAVDFIANGLPRQPGAPYAEPCIDDNGNPIGSPRMYKAADLQIDAILNKAGWHFPQQRMIALWQDVQPTVDGTKPPEPLFFRANTNDCITYWLTNLVPNIYELDDFQVRTPTDVLGEHIHLVKFDVTSSDGAANGWNYEDASFSPDEVRERINAIRAHNNCVGDAVSGGDARDGTFDCPVAKVHPFFGPGPDKNNDGVPDWIGAMTNVQRWFADDVLDLQGHDRTLRTVFTHDHLSPSTHQQAGLYAGLVVEPQGSTWRNPETGAFMYTRPDGGPTSWRADILTGDTDGDGIDDSHREFMVEFGDFQLAYKPNDRPLTPWTGVARQPGEGLDDPPNAINPPGIIEGDIHDVFVKPLECPGGVPLPCPEIISAADVGTMSTNYRNEPIALRVRDPANNDQAQGEAGDLANAFRSDIVRADPAFNVQPNFYPPLTAGVQPGDPFTPLMRAYANDKVQVRVLVGAHEEGHNFSINGIKWPFEPSDPNSGWRNSQMMGISEHFEFLSPLTPAKGARGPFTDYAYKVGSSQDDLWNGIWGILRSYRNEQADLLALPNNQAGGPAIANPGDFDGVCPKSAPMRVYDVTAVTAQAAVPGGRVIYNSRSGFNNEGPLNDPTGLLYVQTADLKNNGTLKTGVPIEPLVLRADAGDCIEVILRNGLPAVAPDLDGWNGVPPIVDLFNANDLTPSSKVGLHAQLVAYDVSRDDGQNVGFNGTQSTAPQGGIKDRYFWYAGDLKVAPDGTLQAIPVEFGATGLAPADPIKHSDKGLVGALVVEPQGATWATDSGTRTAATVTRPDGSSFREFVVVFQDDINLRFGDGSAIPVTAAEEDAEDSGQKALNYRTEPMWFRMGYAPDTPLTTTRTFDFSNVLSNSQVGGDPKTPVFTAQAGQEVRFRVVHPGGHSRNHIFSVHGHSWQHEPYVLGSTQIGDNVKSMRHGSQMGVGPSSHFDEVIESAGGAFQVPGDYLFRDFQSFMFDGGLWGILRVAP